MQEKPEKCEVCITLTDEKKSGIIFSKLGDDKNNMLFKGRKRCWIMYETVKVIRLSDMDEVKDFVRAAGGCDFDIDSLFGHLYHHFTLDNGKIVKVNYKTKLSPQ